MTGKLSLPLRLWAAAILAIVGLQAIPVHSLPDQPTHGSAFSASTSEVSLAARRLGVAAVQVVPAPLPRLALFPIETVTSVTPSAAPWPAHRQTGPPLRPLPLRGGSTPRGPPILI